MNILLLVIEIILLITLSAICSGLNVALMSLQVDDLSRKARIGDMDAARVLPLRQNVHLSLAAILFTNVAVISATSLVLGNVFAGLIAGTLSTILIVIFGEILPQAVFAKQALRFSARFIPLLRLMIVVTYPVTKPLQLLLDALLNDSAGHSSLHSRSELGMIIAEHAKSRRSELDEDEVEIIQNTLLLSEKRVREIMAPLKDVFWMRPTSKISKTTIAKIKRLGHSRIPIFDSELTTCYGILLVKDLVDVDFTEPIAISQFTLHDTKVVGSMTALDTMFRKFIGSPSHLMPITRDDHIVGIVTIEDLIEEILGHEIEDEKDHAKL